MSALFLNVVLHDAHAEPALGCQDNVQDQYTIRGDVAREASNAPSTASLALVLPRAIFLTAAASIDARVSYRK